MFSLLSLGHIDEPVLSCALTVPGHDPHGRLNPNAFTIDPDGFELVNLRRLPPCEAGFVEQFQAVAFVLGIKLPDVRDCEDIVRIGEAENSRERLIREQRPPVAVDQNALQRFLDEVSKAAFDIPQCGNMTLGFRRLFQKGSGPIAFRQCQETDALFFLLRNDGEADAVSVAADL